MTTRIEYLIKVLDDFRIRRAEGDVLESVTAKILADDNYEEMGKEFRERVELLDMWDINTLTPEDLEVAEAYFSRWLSTEQR